MPNGWASVSCVHPSFPPPKRCTATGTAVSNMTSSSVIALCLFTAAPLSGAVLQLFEAVEPHMGTLVRIQVYARDTAQADAAFRAAFARIAQLDAALSDYREDSEVNRLCRAAVNHPVPISSDLYTVLDAALQIAGE